MSREPLWPGDDPMTDEEVMALGYRPMDRGWAKPGNGGRTQPERAPARPVTELLGMSVVADERLPEGAVLMVGADGTVAGVTPEGQVVSGTVEGPTEPQEPSGAAGRPQTRERRPTRPTRARRT